MLNFITNSSPRVRFIRSRWSIFTLFQLPKAISCNCIKATVSTNLSSSLGWRTECPWSWSVPVWHHQVFITFTSSVFLLRFHRPWVLLLAGHYKLWDPQLPLVSPPSIISISAARWSLRWGRTWHVQYFGLSWRLQWGEGRSVDAGDAFAHIQSVVEESWV